MKGIIGRSSFAIRFELQRKKTGIFKERKAVPFTNTPMNSERIENKFTHKNRNTKKVRIIIFRGRMFLKLASYVQLTIRFVIKMNDEARFSFRSIKWTDKFSELSNHSNCSIPTYLLNKFILPFEPLLKRNYERIWFFYWCKITCEILNSW